MTAVYFLSYRGNGDRNVEVLASVVLLVGEEVVPNLKNIEQTKKPMSQKGKYYNFCPDDHTTTISSSTHLVFTRQISSDTSGSLFSHWMNQQIFPCSQEKQCQRRDSCHLNRKGKNQKELLCLLKYKKGVLSKPSQRGKKKKITSVTHQSGTRHQ